MENPSLSKNLVYQRKLKGYTQEELAGKTSVTVRTIQRIEKGDVNPHLQTVKLLAAALEIEVDDLLNLENPKEEAIQNKWLLLLHGTPLLGFGIPLFNILIPLFIWIHKREDNPLYERHGRTVVNFQITMTLLFALSFIGLVTIQGYGFFLFISIIPFVVIVILGNIISVLNTQKCYYPLAIPFLRSQKTAVSKVISILLLFLAINFSASGQETSLFYCPPCDCQAHETNETFHEGEACPYCEMELIPMQNKTQASKSYQQLLKYEGKYDYLSGSTLKIMASPMDTTLYAVIENAKYPLFHVAADTFSNVQDTPVIFQRNDQGDITSYTVDGQPFELITTDITKLVMYPRVELFDHPEGYVYQTPEETNDGLETGHINSVFKKDERIKEMVVATIKGEHPDVHSILIYKDRKLVLEEYFYGYDRNTEHQLRSATKALIGSLVGLAIEAGAIDSEQDRLLPYFKDEYESFDHMSDQKKSITIQNFLTYRHGLDCENNDPESTGNEQQMMKSSDWVKYTLDLPVVTQPGKTPSYCTGAALTLGRLVEIATNKTLEEFADEHLFKPMGITHYDWRFDPDSSSRQTFSQMYLQPRDLVKLATMYMNEGKWHGKQILPEAWVQNTFKEHSSEFGYLWEHKYFAIDGKQYNSYMTSGNGGQKINIWPEFNMVTVFTGGNYNSYELYGKSTPPNQMIPKYILPSLN
ncbi:serine hydrolase [Rhodohalobacter sp.]|uniref:serine hydrolase n=1 Tax=Rhodohalobacter sp. TaxID=1974210 RepID=UPI002ACD5D62|nr:serine hydrolase [Rhodohalobacter sp.]MDZ7755027.1 serine hydrolase [Rhodohalobacter sp.]